MRRASSPAIWTTPSRAPLVVSRSSAVRSLSSLALSRSAERNAPGRYSTASTRPSTGMRCTCTSSTERNTLTRGAGTAGRSSSGGGRTSATVATVPSAAASTTPSTGGVPGAGSGRTPRSPRWRGPRARRHGRWRPARRRPRRPHPRRAGVRRGAWAGRPPGPARRRGTRRNQEDADRTSGGSAPRRSDPVGPRLRRSRYARARGHRLPCCGCRGAGAPQRKGPGPSSPETTTPAVEPLVRSPATGGGISATPRWSVP